jgi:hypothetical protein
MNHWMFSMDIWIYLGYIWMFHWIYLDVTKKNGGIVMGRHPKYIYIYMLLNEPEIRCYFSGYIHGQSLETNCIYLDISWDVTMKNGHLTKNL